MQGFHLSFAKKRRAQRSFKSSFITSVSFMLCTTFVILTFGATQAMAQRYRGSCSIPRVPNCIQDRSMDDRRIQQCQRQVDDYNRQVTRAQQCLDREYRTKEREAQRMVEELKTLQKERAAAQTAIRDVAKKFQCTLSGKSFCR